MQTDISDLIGQVLAAQTSGATREEDQYFVCGKCAQAVDARSIVQVFHHLQPGHRKFTDAELTALFPFLITRKGSQFVLRVLSGLCHPDADQEA